MEQNYPKVNSLGRRRDLKTVLLMRHGESSWNKKSRVTSWADVFFIETGLKEACELVAGWMMHPGHWHSPLYGAGSCRQFLLVIPCITSLRDNLHPIKKLSTLVLKGSCFNLDIKMAAEEPAAGCRPPATQGQQPGPAPA